MMPVSGIKVTFVERTFDGDLTQLETSALRYVLSSVLRVLGGCRSVPTVSSVRATPKPDSLILVPPLPKLTANANSKMSSNATAGRARMLRNFKVISSMI
jgi:hypothetical protein